MVVGVGHKTRMVIPKEMKQEGEEVTSRNEVVVGFGINDGRVSITPW